MLASKQGGGDHELYWVSTSQKCAACRHLVSTQMVEFVPRQSSGRWTIQNDQWHISTLQHMQAHIVTAPSHLQAPSALPARLTRRCSTLAVIVPGCTQQESFEVLPSPKARCPSSTGDVICTGFAAGLIRETYRKRHTMCAELQVCYQCCLQKLKRTVLSICSVEVHRADLCLLFVFYLYHF